MSRLRYRVTAVVLGGLLLGAPLLTNGTASAGQGEGEPELVFGSGRGLACGSPNDVDSMIVPAESVVTVVNRTGHPAQLLVEGAARGTLPEGGVTRVVSGRSTTVVSLDPDCPPDGRGTADPITVAPSDQAGNSGPGTDPSTAEPTGADPSTAEPSRPAAGVLLASASPEPSASRSPAVADPIDAVGALPAKPQPPAAGPRSASSPAPARADGTAGGWSRQSTAKDLRRATGAGARKVPGKLHASGVPGKGSSVTKATTASPAEHTTKIAAGVLVTRPTPQPPIGLLALVAAVCAIGVGCAAIRAFAVQRAYRAMIA